MMNAMSAPRHTEPVEVTLTRRDRSASIVTTLYDLIVAVQDVADDDDTLVVATVRYILGASGTTWRSHVASCTS